MRKSKLETAQTRQRIIATAAAEFRRNGINSTGLSDLMATAGLTHGGFYRHFSSKDQLVTEACASAIDAVATWFTGAPPDEGHRSGIETLVTAYLSANHRDNPAEGCPFAALGSELARADKDTRAVATEGMLRIVGLLAQQFPDMRPDLAKRRALAAFATMVGALTLARMVTDAKLSALLLREGAKQASAGGSDVPSPHR